MRDTCVGVGESAKDTTGFHPQASLWSHKSPLSSIGDQGSHAVTNSRGSDQVVRSGPAKPANRNATNENGYENRHDDDGAQARTGTHMIGSTGHSKAGADKTCAVDNSRTGSGRPGRVAWDYHRRPPHGCVGARDTSGPGHWLRSGRLSSTTRHRSVTTEVLIQIYFS